MRSEWCRSEDFKHLLASLMPANRLALETSLATGLRIGDVLALKSASLSRRMTITESKTGKKRNVYLPKDIYDHLLSFSGKIWVFEHRLDYRKHRTREAVYKDLKRAAKLFRIDGNAIKANITPHSARKIYAVDAYHRTDDIKRVKALLNHSREAVTMLYAMADVLTARRIEKKR